MSTCISKSIGWVYVTAAQPPPLCQSPSRPRNGGARGSFSDAQVSDWRELPEEHQSLFHMAVYDEDVLKNPFYLSLGKQRPDLCSWVAEHHGVVLVPCCGSVRTTCFSPGCFEDHVLQPMDGGYRTFHGKEIVIENRLIKLGVGFPVPAAVPILFEETFYNEMEQSYSILCIAGSLSVIDSRVDFARCSSLSPVTPSFGLVSTSLTLVGSPRLNPTLAATVCCLKDAKDVRNFLGQHADKLDEFIGTFCRAFKEQEKELQYHVDSVNILYRRCLQCLLKDSSRLRALAKQELQMTLLKQAVEIYIHNEIHDFIFQYVGTIKASQDAIFNKTTRSLQDLQQKDLGIKSEFSTNVPRAKRELSQLNRCKSPLQKLLCLRKVAFTVMQPPGDTVNLATMCADDLLSILLYLLVKTEIPNWVANLSYIKNFHFCHSAKDDLSYYLTSFEAAVEYISQGHLSQPPLGSGVMGDKVFLNTNENLLSHSSSSPLDHLFEQIARGNEPEVQRLLSAGEATDGAARMCHPLCSCERCERWFSGRTSDPSVVTPSSQDDKGYTPLHVAAVCGQPILVDLLVSKGAQVNATDYHGLTPLHLSCQKGFQDVTLLLLHHKANRDVQDNNGNTPLHFACAHGHEDCVKALVHYDLHSCRLEIQNDKGDTPLHIAAHWGYDAIIKVLLDNGANTAVQNKSKDTPLNIALNTKVSALLELSCNRSARRDSNSESKSSQPSSDSRSRHSSISSTSSLISDMKPEISRVRYKEVERLLRAVADGDLQMVQYLLEWVDEELGDGEPPQQQSELCHPLCQCPDCNPPQKPASSKGDGLDVNSSNPEGVTSLHVAAQHGHATLMHLLARRGANINARNSQSATPLHLACQSDHPQVVMSLLEFGPKLNKKDQHGNTPLMYACLRGHLDAASALLQGGAFVNATNNQGNTALHLAVTGGHRGLVERLLQAGASICLKNSRRMTPLDWAQETEGRNGEIVKLLQMPLGLSPGSLVDQHTSEPCVALGEKASGQMLQTPDDLHHGQQEATEPSHRDTQDKLSSIYNLGTVMTRTTSGFSADPAKQQLPMRRQWRRTLQRRETLEGSDPFTSLQDPTAGTEIRGAEPQTLPSTSVRRQARWATIS
ncbi:ankyrin repeat domain-containing protein 27-like [Arapaima gigas]